MNRATAQWNCPEKVDTGYATSPGARFSETTHCGMILGAAEA